MKELGFFDQAMLKLEAAGMSPIYMCGAFILETAGSPYPVDGKVIADHLAACMEEIPLMRQRLIQDPLKLGSLRLVEDPDFAVRNHVSQTELEAPGGYEELTMALAAVSSQHIELTRPLWQFQVISGLAGRQIAVAAHIHHAIMDGMSGMRMMGRMFSHKPVRGRKPRAKNWKADPLPTPIDLLGGTLTEALRRLYIRTPAFGWHNAGPVLQTLREQVSAAVNKATTTDRQPTRKPTTVHKTSLNAAQISPARTVSYVELPLDEVKALTKAFDCSINDLALLFGSFALEHYFAGIGEKIDFDLIAGMPIDVRSGDDAAGGNALSFARVNLHNRIVTARARLKAISGETVAIKRSARPAGHPGKPAAGIDFKALSAIVSPLLMDVLASGVVRLRLMDRLPLMNVGISNVPGHLIPPYLAGARIRSLIALAPPADYLALTITVTSTDRYLIFGFHGCADTISETQPFLEGTRRAFRSLKNSAARAKVRKSNVRRPGAGPKKASRPATKR